MDMRLLPPQQMDLHLKKKKEEKHVANHTTDQRSEFDDLGMKFTTLLDTVNCYCYDMNIK